MFSSSLNASILFRYFPTLEIFLELLEIKWKIYFVFTWKMMIFFSSLFRLTKKRKKDYPFSCPCSIERRARYPNRKLDSSITSSTIWSKPGTVGSYFIGMFYFLHAFWQSFFSTNSCFFLHVLWKCIRKAQVSVGNKKARFFDADDFFFVSQLSSICRKW